MGDDKKTNLLKLEREFQTKQRSGGGREASLFDKQKVDVSDFDNLIKQFEDIKKEFENNSFMNDFVIFTVRCKKIMAKSNRLSWLMTFDRKPANEWVVASSFYGENNNLQKISYCISKTNLDVLISKLNKVKEVLTGSFGGSITKDRLNELISSAGPLPEFFSINDVKKTAFINTCQEITYIYDVIVDKEVDKADQNVIVNMIKVPSVSSSEIIKKLGISPIPAGLPDDIYLLNKDDANKLFASVPYLIVNQTVDFSTFDFKDVQTLAIDDSPYIEKPTNEPIIGVIDGLFAKDRPNLFENPYFAEWVENHECLENLDQQLTIEDFAHGTEVDSLLVDLPRLNPDFDDGCGHFRIRHFGVATRYGVSVSYMLKVIRKIVEDPKNSDIQVWNLCLGNSVCEVNKSYISLEGALLDELQSNNPNIIFVVSGTNKKSGIPNPPIRIGAPADSINSIVVNSCNSLKEPASYSRCGPALSFFIKPDVSTYGGDIGEELFVWSPWGKWHNLGTSFAAPLISRKLAFLMGIMKLDRNVAKALLIDSVLKWNDASIENSNYIGRGIVLPDIENIVKGDSDEIKFFIHGRSKEYLSYTYSLPVPICDDNKYHYRARATLCYFPACSRNQGVDYTNTELALQFGRLKKGNKGIDTIDKYRDYLEKGFTFEKDAREVFRKWDNVKTIVDTFPDRKVVGKDVLNSDNKNWGIQITYNERSSKATKNYIDWGLVVTLKATDGINRISEFIHNCEFNGWLVTPIVLENYLNLKVRLNEDIELE